MHIRSQVRSALEARLKERVASVAGHVYSRFEDPDFAVVLDDSAVQHPVLGLAIMTTDIVDEGSASGGRGLQQRDLNVEITIFRHASSTVEEELEATAVEVEAVLGEAEEEDDLGLEVLFLRPVGDELLNLGETDRGDLLGLKLKFTVRVATCSGRPDESLLRG